MANTIAALDFQKCSGIIRRMQECLNNIHKSSGTFISAAEAALEGASDQKWILDIVNIGTGIQKQCLEVSEACDTCVDGLRKYDEDLRDFIDSGIKADI